jgi:hypothetical protein
MNIEIPDELLREGIAMGVHRALEGGIRAEFRAFLEDYFGCLSKQEAAAFFDVSERTIEALWQEEKIPKDTALGAQLPRTWLSALKEFLANSRITARKQKRDSGKLRSMPAAA